MKAHLRITQGLLDEGRADLRRPHPYAAERVGFVLVGAAAAGPDILLLGRSYHRVADAHYLYDPSVGAMMGPDAIREAMQAALRTKSGLFHIHMHDHPGRPNFGDIDRREHRQFVPSFFNAAPALPHGVLLLSQTDIRGLWWPRPDTGPVEIVTIAGPGRPGKGVWA